MKLSKNMMLNIYMPKMVTSNKIDENKNRMALGYRMLLIGTTAKAR
jgi:hypothetical protein